MLSELFDHYYNKLSLYLEGAPGKDEIFPELVSRLLVNVEHSSVLILVSMGYTTTDIVAATSATMSDINHYQHFRMFLIDALSAANIPPLNFIEESLLYGLWDVINQPHILSNHKLKMDYASRMQGFFHGRTMAELKAYHSVMKLHPIPAPDYLKYL